MVRKNNINRNNDVPMKKNQETKSQTKQSYNVNEW